MEKSRFQVAEARSNVACHAKIRILKMGNIKIGVTADMVTYLINCTRNETEDIFSLSKDVRKRVAKRRHGLNSRKSNFAFSKRQ